MKNIVIAAPVVAPKITAIILVELIGLRCKDSLKEFNAPWFPDIECYI